MIKIGPKRKILSQSYGFWLRFSGIQLKYLEVYYFL